jgi:hypothetical protein
VCCKTACADLCRACNLLGSAGTCVAVLPGGLPARAGECQLDPASKCGPTGRCDGAGKCQMADASTVCGPPACDPATNLFTGEPRCDGQGACKPAGGGQTCAPARCNAARTGCANPCAANDDCLPPNQCLSMSCGKSDNDLPCTAGNQCKSNLCVDGVCCNAACDRQCEACDVSNSVGTCRPVTGAPHRNGQPARPACGGPPCAGSCGGADPARCTYPPTACSMPACAGSAAFTEAGACDASGACQPGKMVSCGPPPAPNMQAACNAAAPGCPFLCEAGALGRPATFECSDGAKFCPLWNFESGTADGWRVVSGGTLKAPPFRKSGIGNSTAFLAVQPSGDPSMKLELLLCAGGASISGKAFSYRVFVDSRGTGTFSAFPRALPNAGDDDGADTPNGLGGQYNAWVEDREGFFQPLTRRIQIIINFGASITAEDTVYLDDIRFTMP